MAAPVGSLLVRIGADVRELVRGTKTSKGALQKLGEVGKKAAKALAGAVTAATSAVVALGVQGIIAGDKLVKTADKIGATTKELAGLRFAAEKTGVASDTLDMALQRATRRISEAAQGTGEAKDALKELGLSADELVKLPMREQMGAIADAMNNVETQSDRVRLGFKLFDSEGVALVNTLKLGSEGLAEAAKEAEGLGLAFSRIDAEKLVQANDAMRLARERLKGVRNVIALELAPIISGLSKEFLGVGGSAEQLRDKAVKAVDFIGKAAGVVADVFFGWKLIFKGLETAAFNLSAAVVKSFDKIKVGFPTELVKVTAAVTRNEKLFNAALTAQSANVANKATALRESADAAEREFQALAASAKPSERIAESMARFREEAEAAAQAAAENARNAISGAAGDGGDSSATDEAQKQIVETEAMLSDLFSSIAKKQEAVREQAQKALQETANRFQTEAQMEQTRFDEQLESLAAQLELKRITEEEHRALVEEAELAHQERLTEIEREGLTAREKFERANLRSRVSLISGQLSNITSTVANSSKKLFKVNQAAALAQAAIDLPSAVLQAVKNAGGLPFGAFAGAATAAAGLARISEIRSASFGGGTTPSAAGTTATVNNTPVPQQVVQVQGLNPNDLFNGRQVVDLLNEATKDGAKLVLT